MNGNKKNHEEEGTEMSEIVPRNGSSGIFKQKLCNFLKKLPF